MMIVDTPGFQNPEWGGSARGASFEELCHNYAQDRLQRLFHERTFLQELERYKEVGSCHQGPARAPLHLSSGPGSWAGPLHMRITDFRFSVRPTLIPAFPVLWMENNPGL